MHKSRFERQFLEICNNLCQKTNQGRSANIYTFHDNSKRKCVASNSVDANKPDSTTISYVLLHTGGIY